jgi:probable phosphoglycerate mutase
MRHGHVDYFAPEVVESKDPRKAKLTERGISEAKAAGQALGAVSFDLALCSGLRRTRETAEYVLDWQTGKVPVLEFVPDLEELHSGQFIEFESREQLAAIMTFQFENAANAGATFMEGGELFSDALIRTTRAIEELLLRPGWHTALIVAHEGVNRILLSWMCNAELDASVAFEQDTACINILDFDLVIDESGLRQIERKLIKSVNLTPLNYEKHGMNLRSLEAIFHRE